MEKTTKLRGTCLITLHCRRKLFSLVFAAVYLLSNPGYSNGFVVTLRSSSSSPLTSPTGPSLATQLFATDLPDIGSMKIGELKSELESYGISTKSFLEKKEMKEAVDKARKEGKKPKKKKSSSKSKSAKSSSKSEKKKPGKGKATREEKIAAAMTEAKGMSVGELRKALKGMGVSTKSFFEKTEFIKAYAEATVDGGGKGTKAAAQEEEHDPSYRDVSVQKLDTRDPRLMRGTLIDIKLK